MTRPSHLVLGFVLLASLLGGCISASFNSKTHGAHTSTTQTATDAESPKVGASPNDPGTAGGTSISSINAAASPQHPSNANNQASLVGMDVRLSSCEAGVGAPDTMMASGIPESPLPAAGNTLAMRSDQAGQEGPKSEAKSLAELFLRAVQSGAYDVAWGKLTPEAQSAWDGHDAFAQFYREKFGANPIISFALGTASESASWIDPSSGAKLEGIVSVPLTLLAKNGSAAIRIGGPAIRLLSTLGGWRIARLGAAGPDGAIVIPRDLPARSLHVPILMYHHVAPTPVRGQYRTEYDYRLAYDLTVSPEAFADQLAYLQTNGYHPVTAHALLNYLYYGVSLPAKPVALTFDDGYLDNVSYAFGALQSHLMIATFNVITGLIGQQSKDLRYMSWDDLKAMVDQGMDVESHTVTHHDLGTLSSDAALLELVQSRVALQEHLNVAADVLTYPSGEPFRSGSVARRQEILRLLPRAGYAGALLDQRTNGTFQRAQEPYQLVRVRVAGGEQLRAFGENLSTSGP